MENTSAPKLVVIYDATAAGVCARTMRLVGRVSLESGQRIGLWAFHELQADETAPDRAAAEAVGADLVIFVAHSNQELPPRVLKWVEGWLPLKKGAMAGLGLLQDPEPAPGSDSASVGTVLRRMAQRAGLDFFCNTFDCPQPNLEDRVLTRLGQTAVAKRIVPLFGADRPGAAEPPRDRTPDPAPRRRIS